MAAVHASLPAKDINNNILAALPAENMGAQVLFLHTDRTGDKRTSAAIKRGIRGRKHCLT